MSTEPADAIEQLTGETLIYLAEKRRILAAVRAALAPHAKPRSRPGTERAKITPANTHNRRGTQKLCLKSPRKT
jgi:hypothetical protein